MTFYTEYCSTVLLCGRVQGEVIAINSTIPYAVWTVAVPPVLQKLAEVGTWIHVYKDPNLIL